MNIKNLLMDICTFRRGHNSKGEKAFIKKYMSDFVPFYDSKGEVIAYGYDNLKPCQNRILWSSHIDTVHNPKGKVSQSVYCDSITNVLFIDEKTADCLGADCGSGVALMLSMIDDDVHGYYLFHRGEELGRIGSQAMAECHSDFIESFTHAVAFDRRSTDSIITHQSGQRCCSEKFSSQLAELLSMDFKSDDTGSYTDTYSYIHLIDECTNISIGYDSEHTSRESQNINHLIALYESIKAVEWENISLVIDRDKTQDEYKSYLWADYRTYYDGYDLSMYDLEGMSFNERFEYLKSLDKYELINLIEDMLYSSRAYIE